MSKLYYNSSSFSTTFSLNYLNLLNFFISSSHHFMPLPFIKFIPLFSLALLSQESIIFSDLASVIAPSLNISIDSASKSISRFLKNKNFDFNFFYSSFISFIFSNFKIKHPDKRIHISLDHMYIENRFTVFMFTLKIGKIGIPLWFRSFFRKGSDAYSFDLFKEGILFCHNLIKNIDPSSNIIFLADRFFGNHFKLMSFIDSLGDTYCFRCIGNLLSLSFDKKENHLIYKPISSLSSYVYHSSFFDDILISRKHFKTNLAISKKDKHKEPFYILTNGESRRAIKDYSYRFASIEFCFKAQKSNGFFLEETQVKDLYTFNSLYTCVCLAYLLATISGIDYSKNISCYKHFRFITTKLVNGKRIRLYSYFNIGLKLFKLSLFSNNLILFKRLILYDI